MTRGMLTVATGSKHYYYLASNLLRSYHLASKNPLPFAIIAEEENEYTALFDLVIITSNVQRSFMDKLLILKYAPFEETLFFDSDCLAYGDLNKYWDYFEGATDFSALGKNVGRNDDGAWYKVEDIWKYGQDLPYKVRVHMGVCFLRKSDSLIKLYNDCIDISENYDRLHFLMYEKSKDEAVMGIAMPMNGMKATREKPYMMAALPCLTVVEADIVHQKLSYSTRWGTHADNGILLHFGTIQTYKRLYRFESENMNRTADGKKSVIYQLLYDMRMRMIFLLINDLLRDAITMTKRIIMKCWKIVNKNHV